MMQLRNAKQLRDGRIDCEIDHSDLGWIPCTVSQEDSETQQLYARILNGEAGEIAPADPLPPELTPEELLQQERENATASRLQARLALLDAGLLDTAETIIAAADRRTREAWATAQYFRRLSPIVTSMGSALGLTDVQLDDLFRAAVEIEA